VKRLLVVLTAFILVGCLGPIGPGMDPCPKDDVCERFDCMVDRCWCDELGPDGPILLEGSTTIETEEEAKELVKGFTGKEPTNVADLNGEFFNVFVDAEGNEEVYTVASDGTIFLTQCGV